MIRRSSRWIVTPRRQSSSAIDKVQETAGQEFVLDSRGRYVLFSPGTCFYLARHPLNLDTDGNAALSSVLGRANAPGYQEGWAYMVMFNQENRAKPALPKRVRDSITSCLRVNSFPAQ